MMKKILGFLGILCLLFVACEKESKSMEENVPETKNVKKLFELMHKDKVGDGYSVTWDGTNASRIEDPLDNLYIDDGPSVSEGNISVTVENAYEYAYPCELKDVSVVDGSEDHYVLSAKNYHIQFDYVDYEKATKQIDESADFEKVKDEKLASYQTKYFNKYQLYQGIIRTEEKDYVGYVLVFESVIKERQIQITCGGIGSLNDIEQVALTIMDKFTVLF